MKASMIIGFVIIVVFIILYVIIPGGSLLQFIFLPSIFVVGGILIGGILISFGCSLPLKALKKALQKEGVKDPSELREYVNVFTMASRLSIAAGIIGTLIGFIQLLVLTDDPKTFGPLIAVALITALYGVLLSELVFQPLKHSLIIKSADNGTRIDTDKAD